MNGQAGNQPKKKRIVKNPESFRERAIKATSESDKPKRSNVVRQGLAKPFRAAIQQLRRVGRFKVFRPLRKPLRIIGYVVFPVYFRNSWRELKQVTWPSFKESIRLTWAVLIFAIVFGTTVALVDYGLDALFKRILLK